MDIKPIRTEADYEAALAEVEKLWGSEPGTPDGDRFEVLFSPVHGQLDPAWLAEAIVKDRLPVRFQVQLHKMIWGSERTGV